ncbi:MAG TPA: WD40 repeat domain-containing protein [Phycisphaerae bacterium]|jgi:WD40 repeat protein
MNSHITSRFSGSLVPLLFLAVTSAASAADDSVEFKGHKRDVNSVAISSDGKLIASGSTDGTVKIWDVDGKNTATRTSDQGAITAVAFSPDGKLVAAGSQSGDIIMWERDGEKDRFSKTSGSSRIVQISFLPDGKTFATASMDHTLRIWDTATGDEKATLKAHKYSIAGMALYPDATKSVSIDSNGNLSTWSLSKASEVSTIEPLKSGEGRATAISPDGKTILAGYYDGTVLFLDADTNKELRRVKLPDPINYFAYSPDGKTVAVATQGTDISLLDPATAKTTSTLKGHGRPVLQVTWSPDGKRLISGSMDTTLRVWTIK